MEDITLTNETIEQYHQRLNGELREELKNKEFLLISQGKELKELYEELEEEKRINAENLKTIDRQQERIDKAIEITKQLLINSADNRMIADENEKDYFDWLDRILIKQLEILKGE